MDRLEKMPEYIKKAMVDHGVSPADIQLVASSDLSKDGKFAESWLVITKDMLFVTEGVYEKAKGTEDGWKENDFSRFPIQELDQINTENLVSGGLLTVKYKGEDIVLCRYSNTHARKFGIVAKLLNKLKGNHELTDEDFQDEHAPAYCPKCGLLYPDQNRKVCPRCLDKRAVFIRVLSLAPRYKLQIFLILVCMLLSSGLNLLNPYISGNIFFDEVLKEGGRYYHRIFEVVLLMIGARILALLISIAYGRLNSSVAAEIVYDIKTEVFSAMQRLSLSFYNNRQTGGLMTRVNQDAMHLQSFFHDGLPYFIVNSLTIIGIGITMFLVNWRLALLVLLPTPIIAYFLYNIFPKLWNLFHRNFRKSHFLNSLINDAFTGMRVVKAFGKEDIEINRFSIANEGVRSVSIELGTTVSTLFPAINFIMGIGGIIVWGVGGWEVMKGNMTFGTLVTFTGYIGMLYGPIQFMTEIVHWWSDCMNSAVRIFEILDSVPDVAEAPNPVRIPVIKGDVILKDVTFSYEPNKPVLHNINLDVKAGEMIGLVGHSGAGKSTITNLITRLYDVEEGAIYIDDVNVKQIAIKDLRSQIGMVLQETFLFNGTIAENIAYAKPTATMEEIIRAAKAANAHDFIIRLPDGYDTIIGRHGYNLSGGERQRISIARAILHDPKILILDEATASLDTETERQIQEALERLIKGRTTFAIAHRLSTLRDADRLVVIEQGKIVEMGTHIELVKKKGVYFKLLEKQRNALKLRGIGE